MIFNVWHFSTNTIAPLERFNASDRRAIILIAHQQLNAPQKLVLSLLKLICLVPIFFFLAREAYLYTLLSTVAASIIYLTVSKPLHFHFLLPGLGQAIKKFEIRNTPEDD